jgi:hypothetical protein
MKQVIQKILFGILCLLFTLLGCISLGALGEDYTRFANLLNHLLNKTLIIICVYAAIKLPLIMLLKSTLINSFCALLSWKAIVKPNYLKELFTFRRKEVYYMQRKSLNYEIKKLIPLFNKNVGLENKINFCMNPVSILISIISCIKEYWIYAMDTIANNLETCFNKFKKTDSININISPSLLRFSKGIVVIICELLMLLLKFAQPIANLPYWVLHFIAITAPDFLANLFNVHGNTTVKNSVAVSPNTPNNLNVLVNYHPNQILAKQYSHHKQNTVSLPRNKNSKYIKEQLEDLEDLFS